MSLPISAIRYLQRICDLQGIVEPVLTLGRQRLFCSSEELVRILAGERIDPAGLAKGTSLATDKELFAALGVKDLSALDISDYEGATLRHDLNHPIADNLKERFGLVIDGGTIEHVFNVPQALFNMASMLKVGGSIVHMSPANGYLGHGFYQLCPELLNDFYLSNGFGSVECFLAEHVRPTVNRSQWNWYRYDFEKRRKRFYANEPIGVYFYAVKERRISELQVPQQVFSSATYTYEQDSCERPPWDLEQVFI